MKMCNRNYGSKMWKDAGVRDDGIDLKKLHAAMRRDSERICQRLTALLCEAKAMRADPAFTFPDDDADEPEPLPVVREEDFEQRFAAWKNGELNPAEDSEFVVKLAKAIVEGSKIPVSAPLPLPAMQGKPSAAVKAKRNSSKKKQ